MPVSLGLFLKYLNQEYYLSRMSTQHIGIKGLDNVAFDLDRGVMSQDVLQDQLQK